MLACKLELDLFNLVLVVQFVVGLLLLEFHHLLNGLLGESVRRDGHLHAHLRSHLLLFNQRNVLVRVFLGYFEVDLLHLLELRVDVFLHFVHLTVPFFALRCFSSLLESFHTLAELLVRAAGRLENVSVNFSNAHLNGLLLFCDALLVLLLRAVLEHLSAFFFLCFAQFERLAVHVGIKDLEQPKPVREVE